MIIGGGTNINDLGFDKVLEYDIDTDSYSYLPSLPYRLRWGTTVKSGNYMYVFGGWIELVVTDRVLRISLEKLDLNTTIWEDLNPMTEAGRRLMVVPYNFS